MKKGKERIRKLTASLANIALILSIFVVLFPLALPTVRAEPDLIIYVDDDFESEDDTHKKTIQGGVDAAAESGAEEPLVRVYNGTYKEKVSIYSTLTLQGNHSSNTTIDAEGTGTVITITASWVNITGFTVTNGTRGVHISSDYVAIYNTNITSIQGENGVSGGIGGNGDIGAGIYLDSSFGTNISDNKIFNIDGGNGGNSSNNYRTGGAGGVGAGIYLQTSTNNIIIKNTINTINGGAGGTGGVGGSDGAEGDGVGIYMQSCEYNNLYINTIFNNSDFGLYITGGYRHNISQNNTINNETVYYFYDDHDALLVENLTLLADDVSNVGKITLAYCSNIILRNNNVSNNSFGIFLYGSEDLTLWNNSINNSYEVGLYIAEGYHHYITENNTVRGRLGQRKWENISYYTDNINIQNNISKDFYLPERGISNVGKLSFINCTNVTITNNTLAHAVPWYKYGIGVFLYSSSNCTIVDNTFGENKYSIRLIESDSNNITNNSFSNKHGILFEYSNNNSVSKCNFTHGTVPSSEGIIVINSYNITIMSNNMTSSHYSGTNSMGIYVANSNASVINNTFNKMCYGVVGLNSVIRVENNNFYQPGIGIMIKLRYCDNRTKILNNTINFTYPSSHISDPRTGLTVSIYMEYSSPLIENNTSIHTYAPPSIGRPRGNNHQNIGHMAVYFSSAPIIKNNYFYGSSWGISLMGNVTAEITENVINGTDIGINVASSDQLGPGENLSNTASYAKIDGNYINYTHSWGINFNLYNNGSVTNNTILHSGGLIHGCGIFARGGADQFIAHNNVSYNVVGVRVVDEDTPTPPFPTVYNNTVIGNTYGIYMERVDNSPVIDKNTVVNNSQGIIIWDGSPTVINNTVMSSDDYGIFVGTETPPLISSPSISNNTIEQNTNGIYIIRSDELMIDNNNINNNSYGLRFRQSDDNQITSNTFYNNSYDTLCFELSDGNYVFGNEIEDNKRGIFLTSSNNTNITDNSKIKDSTDYGIMITGLVGGNWTDNFENEDKIENNSNIEVINGHAELKTLILDNFDDDTTGQPPDDWVNASTGGAYALVSTEQNVTENQSVKFYDPANADISAITRNFNETEGVIIDFWARAEQTDANFTVLIGNDSTCLSANIVCRFEGL